MNNHHHSALLSLKDNFSFILVMKSAEEAILNILHPTISVVLYVVLEKPGSFTK